MLFEEIRDQLNLRPQVNTDADFLFTLYASTRAEEMALVDWNEHQKSEFLVMQFTAQSKFYRENYSQAQFDIIELEGASIGRLYLDTQDRQLRIIDIAVLPNHRRKGIGAYYMQRILDRATRDNRSVTIHVEKNNPALSLYERLGFEIIEDKDVYWFMRWPVSATQENTAS